MVDNLREFSNSLEEEKIEVKIDIKKFIIFHKRRVNLLKRLTKESVDGKLIFQISFIGIESLAKVIHSDIRDPGERFNLLLSKTLNNKDRVVSQLYPWRNSLTHQSFILDPWTTLEAWSDEEINFVSFPEKKGIRSSVEYPPESIIEIYDNLIDYLADYFEKMNMDSKIIIENKRSRKD
ncbi:MAG: hypothetical protein Q7S56_01165 [Nanoarchaeota archaeon]|nr:hypothetical protein [Nanoarchaeota archaeon]